MSDLVLREVFCKHCGNSVEVARKVGYNRHEGAYLYCFRCGKETEHVEDKPKELKDLNFEKFFNGLEVEVEDAGDGNMFFNGLEVGDGY